MSVEFVTLWTVITDASAMPDLYPMIAHSENDECCRSSRGPNGLVIGCLVIGEYFRLVFNAVLC